MFRTITLIVCLAAGGFAGTQKVVLEDTKPRDLTTAAASAIQFVKDDASIPDIVHAKTLIGEALAGTTPNPPLTSPDFVAIIYVVNWKQTATTPASSHWYVVSGDTKWDNDAFSKNNRIFGKRHVVLIYAYVNLPAGFSQHPEYEVDITSKMAAPLVHLFQLASAFTPLEKTSPVGKFGAFTFDAQYLPSDISITPYLAAPDSVPETVTKTGEAQVFDDEGNYHFDFSVGVPIKKMGEVKFDNTANTVSPQTVDKRTMFALIDIYPFKKDIKSTAFDWHPYGVAGVGVANQPLHRILVGMGWGPQFAQFYAGALFTEQQSLATLQAGSAATPAQQAADTRLKFGTQFAFGINIPIARAIAALAASQSKNSGTSTKSNTQKNANPANTPANPGQ